MNYAWAWVLVMLILLVSGISRRWFRLKEKQIDALKHQSAEKAEQYAAHTDRLEQRMRVLERIVTDKGIDVAEEIERLRDRPVN
jgi:uncharacterized protein YicC (UPF0701 family)